MFWSPTPLIRFCFPSISFRGIPMGGGGGGKKNVRFFFPRFFFGPPVPIFLGRGGGIFFWELKNLFFDLLFPRFFGVDPVFLGEKKNKNKFAVGAKRPSFFFWEGKKKREGVHILLQLGRPAPKSTRHPFLIIRVHVPFFIMPTAMG
jgi:hypothetical protein